MSAELYGYVKLDASCDTAQTSPGDFYRIVTSNSQNVSGSNQFNMTANQSRVGINLGGPKTLGAKLTGKLEIDFYNDNFYGTNTTPSTSWDNKPIPMLRLAYASLLWEDSDVEFIAGQAWDIISPLLPTVLNYFVGWNNGNLGYRRPQLRVNKGFTLNSDSKLMTQLALAKTVGSDTVQPFGASVNNGNDMNFPQMQARIAAQSKLWSDRPAALGIYGHYGAEKFYTSPALTDRDRVTTWSIGADLTVPILDNLTFLGEVTRGANLRMFLGGINNGVYVVNGDPRGVQATDFWTQLAYKPQPRLQLNLGGGQSKCDLADFPNNATTIPVRNSFVFINAIYNLSKPLTVGLELTQLGTDYYAAPFGRSGRIQTSLQYTF